MNDSTQWTLPPARQEDYEGRDRHWNLRKMMLAAAKDCCSERFSISIITVWHSAVTRQDIHYSAL